MTNNSTTAMEKFLSRYESKLTRETYKSALKKFFSHIGIINPELYFRNPRDYEEDVENFFESMRGKPPKTIRLYLNTVKSYLKSNKIKFDDDFWDDINRRIRGSRARTIDRIPTIEELKAILTHADAKARAIILMLATSGMRIGEALSIKVSDIKLEEEPGEIRIRGEFTKTGDPRITFISKEAKQALKEWLKVRKQYLITACGRSRRYEKNPDDDRLFPFDSSTAWRIWSKALKKAGLEEFDPSTNRRTVHIHVLRKFFRTRASLVINGDFVQALMGHSNGLDAIYLKVGDIKKELRDMYKKAEKQLLIFTDIKTIKEYTSNLEERLVNKNKDLEKEILKLRTELFQVNDILRKAIDVNQHPEAYFTEEEHRRFERRVNEEEMQEKEWISAKIFEDRSKMTAEEKAKEQQELKLAIALSKQKRCA